jgi:nucleotide-binding universal stress UspA family protein
MPAVFPCRHLLVPIDFSDDSQRSLAYALGVVRAVEGGRLTLLTVVEDRFPYPELFAWDNPDEEFYRSLRKRALERMEQILGELGAHGVPVERLVVVGNPRREIVEMAREVAADLVVMARHGSSGLRAALMGSTTESVVRASTCPVLVLPPAEEGPAAP